MRYNIPEVEFDKIKKVVVLEDIKVLFTGASYLIFETKKLKHYMYALNRFAKTQGSNDFAEWVEPFVEYPFRLYDLMANPPSDVYEAPMSYDFKTVLKEKLHKKLLPKVQGKPTSVEYYEFKRPLLDNAQNEVTNFLGQTVYEYVNIIARVDFTLKYDSLGFLEDKKAPLRWYREDGKLSVESKNLGKTLDPVSDHEDKISEGKMRRESIINGLQIPVLDMIKQAMPEAEALEILSLGRNFMDIHDEVFRDFIDKSLSVMTVSHVDFGKKVAWVAIRDLPSEGNEWLDFELDDGNTARQYMLDELDI